MKNQCIVLVTGAGGDAQGWGDMHVTEAVREAVLANGFDCRIVLAEDRRELERGLGAGECSLVWSSLYFFSVCFFKALTYGVRGSTFGESCEFNERILIYGIVMNIIYIEYTFC